MSSIFGNSYQKLLERRNVPEQPPEEEISPSSIQSIPIDIGNPFQESAAKVVSQGGGKIAESTPQWIARSGARTVARAIETPGDIASSIQKMGQARGAIEEYVETGKMPSPEEQEAKILADIRRNRTLLNQRKLSPEEEKKMAKRKEFMTGDYLREIEKKYTGEYLQPHTEGEKAYDDFVQDVTASVIMPEAGAFSTSARTLETGGRAIVGSALAQFTKQAVKAYGGSPTAQEASKIAPLFLANMFCPSGTTNLYRQFYTSARQAAGIDTTNARSLDTALRIIEQRMRGGTETAATREVLGQINRISGIRRHIRNGRIPLQNLSASKATVNSQLQKYMIGESSSSQRATAKSELLNINHALTETINQTERTNPAYHQAQRAGDEVFGAIAESQKPVRFLMEHGDTLAKLGISGAVIKALYGGVPQEGKILSLALKGGSAAIALATGYKGIQIGYRILRSPILRRYYFEGLNAASRQNLPVFANSIRKLLGKAKEEDPELLDMLENKTFSPETE